MGKYFTDITLNIGRYFTDIILYISKYCGASLYKVKNFLGAHDFKYGLYVVNLYQIPGVGLLELPSLPDTSLYTTKELSYSAGGLEITPVEPMQSWKIFFDGKMR